MVKTPKLSADDVLIERNYTFLVNDNKEMAIDLGLTLRGKVFENFRYFIYEKDEVHQKNEVSKNSGIKDLKINNWNVVNYERDSSHLQIKVDGTSSTILRKIGSFQVINPLRIEMPDFENPNERQQDVIIHIPLNQYDKSVYDLQKFKQNKIQVPDGITIKNKFGIYHTDYLKNGNELIVYEKFTLYANNVSIDKYDEFYEFINSINMYKKKNVILIK